MIRQPLRLILLLVALIAAALPASAAARVRLPYPDDRSDEPPTLDLAGEQLVTTKNLTADTNTLLSPRRVGVFAAPLSGAGGWRLLHRETLRLKPNESLVAFEVSASADRIALLRQGLDEEGAGGIFGVRGSLRAGPLGGFLTSLLSCGGDLPSPAADGRLVAYVSASCSSTKITVRDPRRPASTARSLSVGGDVSIVALAGRYLAALVGDEEEYEDADKGEVVLFDHSTGQRVLRIPAPTVEGLAVQADGTLAVTLTADAENTPDCLAYRVAWFSPVQPKLRTLAEPACDWRIRIAADKIAYRAGGSDDERLVLAGLDGSPAHTVARSVQSRRFPLQEFDWDGARVAYGEERCIDAGTVVAGPEEPTETFGPLACPIEILSSSARLARDNSVGIRVRCANGCEGGELGFSKPGYLHYNNTPGRFVRFRVAPGKTQTVRIRLSGRQAARLRREGSSVLARAKALSPYVNESKDVMLRAGK